MSFSNSVLVRKLENGSAEIVILDHGLYETLPQNLRSSLSNLWKAVVMNNHADMRKFSLELGISGKKSLCVLAVDDFPAILMKIYRFKMKFVFADKDYRLFCIALLQKYVPTEKNDGEDLMHFFFKPRGSSMESPFANLSSEDRNRLKIEATKIHDQLVEVFKKLPGKLVLVCR